MNATEHEARPALRRFVRLQVFAFAYASAYWLAYLFWDSTRTFVLVWPPVGIGVAALVLSRKSEWGWLLGIAAVVSFSFNLATRKLFGVSLCFAVFTTAELYVCAWILLRWCRGIPDFCRVRDVVVLLAAAGGATLLVAALAAAVITHVVTVDAALLIRTWWWAHGLSLLTLTPLLVSWRIRPFTFPELRMARVLETLALVGSSVGVAWLTSEAAAAGGTSNGSPRYLAFVVIGWAAFRFGPRGTSAILTLMTLGVLAQSDGWVVTVSSGDWLNRIVLTQLFLGVVGVTGLFLATSVAERDAATLVLGESERRFRAMFEHSANAIGLWRGDGFVLVNAAFVRMAGSAEKSEWIQRTWHDLVRLPDQPQVEAEFSRAMASNDHSSVLQVEGQRVNREVFPLELRLDSCADEGEQTVLVTCRDLTAERRAQGELQRANRALRTVSKCNHVLIHSTEENALFQNICRVIVEHNGYELAWVGLADQDEAKTVRPVGIEGPAARLLEAAQLTWAQGPEGETPVGDAIRTGQRVLSRIRREDASRTAWHRAARQSGVHSVLIFPLRMDGEVYGILSIHSTDSNAFDPQELALLTELAGDMTFGLQSLRTRMNRDRAETDVRRLLDEAEAARLTLLSILEDRQLAEEARNRSEQLYRDAMQNSAIGMALVALDGRWMEVNPALCEIVGYSREEMLETNFTLLTHPDDRGPDKVKVQEMIAGGSEKVELEKRYLHKNGRVVWVRVDASVVRDEAGRPLHMVSQTQDVTARKQAEAALEATAERLALALRVSKFGVWRHNLQTRTSEWDARMFEIFGLTDTSQVPPFEQILGWVLEDDRTALRQWWNAMPTGETSYGLRFRIIRPDGKLRHVELQGTVRTDHQRRPEWSIGVAGDVTDIVQASTESERLRAQLIQSQKMETLGTLAAGVAHDFNNLLTGINGFVELASASLGPGHEAAELLKQARRGAMSARDLVRRILGFSRTTKGNKPVLLNVVEVVRDTAPLIAAAMPANVSLALIVDCDSAPVVGDAGQLQQILMNLCTNAAHAISPRAGTVQIGVQLTTFENGAFAAIPSGCVAGKYVQLFVRDNGVGMSEATQKKIFEPFFTTKQLGEGTGLGLSIVRDIVAAHEGGVKVKSEVGVGTTFEIYLPMAQREADAPAPIVPGVSIRGSGQRILVVDDEPSVASVVRLTLKKSGYDPVIYLSPTEAWAAFQATPRAFDLVIVDQSMPEISGPEFVSRVRTLAPNVPVLMMSGRFENLQTLTPLRFQQLKKPFEISELLAAAKTAMEGSVQSSPQS